MSETYPDVSFYKLDVDDVPEVAEKCNITAMPTLVFFKDGKKILDVIGAQESKIEEAVKENK